MMENTDLSEESKELGGIVSFLKIDDCYLIEYASGEAAKLYILNNHVFRFYMSPTRTFLDYPDPLNPKDTAKINSKNLSDYGTHAFENSTANLNTTSYMVDTTEVQILFDMVTSKMTIKDKRNNKDILIESQPLSYNDSKSTQTLHQHNDEFFFGGGMQNGRFTHKRQVINIVNSNNWVDGGVTSPCPFYWSTFGYGVLRNTWQPGIYDFGSKSPDHIKTIHKGEDFDAFFFINSQPADLFRDYYELTGRPIFIPEYAFYEAHLNAFNRDYWVKVTPKTPNAIVFEDGYYYKSYQPKELGEKKGILESLNGENNNYQFSARAMIDRYKMHDMPLGWFIPNDGYGCGYGQTDSLDGDIENLKKFADYSRQQGVEVALWTESNLHPADPDHPKKGERDLNKEIGEAGVIALKCDVAWVGSGYSFGLSAVEDATHVFKNSTRTNARPLIIMVDGWAGTQRYSAIWSGDQKGGEWEYIRFHIPTYIGSGLSGQPLVGSDMDGIYAGGHREVNIRDFQWKAFTPLQLNMDGWGSKPKTPFAYDVEAEDVNRAYLKLKSTLLPYNYTIARESVHGFPMIRAMFLKFPEEAPAYTTDSQYQYMWGPYILVSPIYNEEKNVDGKSVRNGLFLPDKNQVWIDFFTGQKYQGGKVINNVLCPIWKIPIFIKSGAILPMVNPNNNPYEVKRNHRIYTLYPDGDTTFEVYEDDGKSSEYLQGIFAKTLIHVYDSKANNLYVHIGKTLGTYKGMVLERTTLIQLMASNKCDKIKVAINGVSIEVREATTEKEFDKEDNAFIFKEDFVVNPYFETFESEELQQTCILIKIQSVNVTESEIQLKIIDYAYKGKVVGFSTVNEALVVPSFKNKPKTTPTTIALNWDPVTDAEFYEIERDGVIFTNITGKQFTFEGFEYDSKHNFRIRSCSSSGVSNWSGVVEFVTKSDPYTNIVKGIQVHCNIPCEPSQEVCKLTDGDFCSMWHTDWGDLGRIDPSKNHFLIISFDLGNVYKINKMEYVPRHDAGNGTFLELQYKFSTDNIAWTEPANTVVFPQDETVKKIPLNGAKFRYMALKVLNTVGGFGSGRQILFYRED